MNAISKKKTNGLHTFQRWVIAIVFAVILVVILSFWITSVSETKAWMLLIFFMVPLIQFFSTPLFTQLKLYTYYSPMVVVFGNNRRVLDLHNGSSFDYLLKMRTVKPGIEWKKRMLNYYLEALLKIIGEIEANRLNKEVTIRGSSYFITERSSRKLGFNIYSTSLVEKVNIALNYIDLIWMYSLSEGKLVLPNLSNIKTVSIKGNELMKHKAYIQNLINYLSKKESK